MLATLDMEDEGVYHGRIKSLGRALTHVTLNQRPPLGAGAHLSIRRSSWSSAADAATAECVIGSIIASKNCYDVGLLIEDWDDEAMTRLFLR